MAADSNSTPAPARGIPDAQLSRAYLGLENDIHKLKSMAALMSIVAETTIERGENHFEKRVREQTGLDKYHLYILTDEENNGLHYSLNHIRDLIRDLSDKYDGAFSLKGAA